MTSTWKDASVSDGIRTNDLGGLGFKSAQCTNTRESLQMTCFMQWSSYKPLKNASTRYLYLATYRTKRKDLWFWSVPRTKRYAIEYFMLQRIWALLPQYFYLMKIISWIVVVVYFFYYVMIYETERFTHLLCIRNLKLRRTGCTGTKYLFHNVW